MTLGERVAAAAPGTVTPVHVLHPRKASCSGCPIPSRAPAPPGAPSAPASPAYREAPTRSSRPVGSGPVGEKRDGAHHVGATDCRTPPALSLALNARAGAPQTARRRSCRAPSRVCDRRDSGFLARQLKYLRRLLRSAPSAKPHCGPRLRRPISEHYVGLAHGIDR